MIWTLRCGIIWCVAGVTISWCSGVACGVALGAGGGSMNAGKREVSRCVVKISIQPVVRVVAHRAVNRVNLSFMILGSVILYLMTSNAIGWRIEYRSRVARGALGNSRVSAGQLKASRSMVKGRWLPSGRGMASLTLNG